MFTSVKFGDVFEFNEKYYIFLAKTEDIIYVAQILSPIDSDKVRRMCEVKLKQAKNSILLKNNPLYCYVVLRTEEFKERLAHFHQSQKNETDLIVEEVVCTLNKDDLKDIKEEILAGAVPLELKGLIKDIDLS
jgi:hypothetical protein